MHKFPANEEQRKIWTKFVRKHRPNFTPTNSLVICSAYFETSCFESRLKSFTKNAVFVCFSLSLSASLRLAQIDTVEQQTIVQRCPHYLLTLLCQSVIQNLRNTNNKYFQLNFVELSSTTLYS